jgi:hypothetical protein
VRRARVSRRRGGEFDENETDTYNHQEEISLKSATGNSKWTRVEGLWSNSRFDLAGFLASIFTGNKRFIAIFQDSFKDEENATGTVYARSFYSKCRENSNHQIILTFGPDTVVLQKHSVDRIYVF